MAHEMIHPSILKAVGYAQARITGGSEIEAVLADECPECLNVPEFAYLVGIDCPSYQQGKAVELDQQAEMLFSAALEKIESTSIREWACSEHNRPVWIRYMSGRIEDNAKSGRTTNPFTLATFIMATYIGL